MKRPISVQTDDFACASTFDLDAVECVSITDHVTCVSIVISFKKGSVLNLCYEKWDTAQKIYDGIRLKAFGEEGEEVLDG